MEEQSKRNLVKQTITLADGTTKNIFHPKPFTHKMSYKAWWDQMNKMAKPNSKRQKRLKKEAEEKAAA
jgi:hypothetical protein